MTASIQQRFFALLVESPNGCMEWSGHCNKKGYGTLPFDGKSRLAHRVAWELQHGPIPHGPLVCHRCDNPPCCNHEHLFLGTNFDNMRDMVAKGRYRKGRIAKGSACNFAKLTDEKVLHIRGLKGIWTHKRIAGVFGISASLVSMIQNRKVWAHLE